MAAQPIALPQAHIQQLAESPQWRALLHWDNTSSRIFDPGFTLDKGKPSLIGELEATLNYLYSPSLTNSNLPQCRFPARYVFLQRSLNLPELDLTLCNELVEFERKVPADNINLVFAAENISSPTSMMGHVFLTLSGTRQDGSKVEHAVSFFTDVNDGGFASLVYQSMVSGKPGFVALRPYREVITRYNEHEGRNLWEYRLATTEFSRTLMRYHLYELKQTQLTYFFDRYNCATVTQFVVALAGATPPHSQLVSPVDVVKFADGHHLITETRVYPAPKWKIRMLAAALNRQDRKLVETVFDGQTIEMQHMTMLDGDDENALPRLMLAGEIANYRLAQMPDEKLADTREQIQNRLTRFPHYEIDLREYKNPLKTPGDSQLALGLQQRRDDNYLLLRYLPAAHKLEDDNRQYFGETELTLADISLAASTNTGKLHLESFTLYGASSFIPRDSFVGGLSGRFKVGMEQELLSDQQFHSSGYLDAALGSSIALGDDIQAYGIAGASLAVARSGGYARAYPEVGLVINEILSMKSVARFRRVATTTRDAPDSSQANFTQAVYFSQTSGGFLSFDYVSNYLHTEKSASLIFKHYF